MEAMSYLGRDPFPDTADPAAYIPRTATEAVLVQLEMELRDGARVLSLVGPPGSGKTMLVRVLMERLAGDFQPVLVPYPKLDPEEFCQWGLFALGEPNADDPEPALAARIARAAGSGDPPLLWLVDDAAWLPIATVRCLLRLQARGGDALRILFAGSDPASLAEELARMGLPRIDVHLDGEMGPAEMAQYVFGRLERAGALPEQRARFEASLDRLHALSGGNPGRLHAAAAAMLCFDLPATALGASRAGADDSEVRASSQPVATPERTTAESVPPLAREPATVPEPFAHAEPPAAPAPAPEPPRATALVEPPHPTRTGWAEAAGLVGAELAPPLGVKPPADPPVRDAAPHDGFDPEGGAAPRPVPVKRRRRLRRLGRRG